MGIETNFNYPSDLNPLWPLGTDYRRDGDNHLRGLKNALKTTFPNLTGAMNASQAELNVLAGAGTAWGVVPQGGIIMWSGSIATIPTGYVLCDGTNGTPNLSDRFVVCATTDDAGVSKTTITGALTKADGASVTWADGGHTHTTSIASHTLTEAQMPAHSHGTYKNSAQTLTGETTYSNSNRWSSATLGDTKGSSSGHNHSATTTGGSHTHGFYPPYYALAFIMKT